jgi:hypothetical protein
VLAYNTRASLSQKADIMAIIPFTRIVIVFFAKAHMIEQKAFGTKQLRHTIPSFWRIMVVFL